MQAGASGYSWAAAHLWRMRALVGGMESEVARCDIMLGWGLIVGRLRMGTDSPEAKDGDC
eukprot:scaffold3303_cov66-Phaeocystis_antarctica.AAC.6